MEFEFRKIPFQREVPLPLFYRGRPLGVPYRADFVCFDSVVVELKAIPFLTKTETAQLAHYLVSTGSRLGILCNFGGSSLEFQRVIGRHAVPEPRESEQSVVAGELATMNQD